MAEYRLSQAAEADIVSILAWSHERFGEQARRRYGALMAAAIREAATVNALLVDVFISPGTSSSADVMATS